ncbi:membrane-associated guanylate kinase, WW and PDZ domain-containing protein 2 [Anopheles darlingi]|uniref:membrane-associated guanylate kinase, WW and PDZ domain-containing protein 2 n=1 Tax=Anopheles darlingi TaxID=43151 RepID=UPI0021004378|nr:membrane-associated guanylate kinase, WW and PDZ domain-containing protein 2 [Anopheles darlingi]XP_049538906.1 membrane-associated guanylate kinase, WW and PDZ domain-containing protein 2 [Anopheles darlingi]XP_049538907.1 membrane-associated guanylate kinase, WW and PDZ domain-containing protein 2 [Anopheles darlingi]
MSTSGGSKMGVKSDSGKDHSSSGGGMSDDNNSNSTPLSDMAQVANGGGSSSNNSNVGGGGMTNGGSAASGLSPIGHGGNNGNNGPPPGGLVTHHYQQPHPAHLHQRHHFHHHEQQHQQPNGGSSIIAAGDTSETGSFYDQKTDLSSPVGTGTAGINHHLEDQDGLGPLPLKWEKAYTDSGEVYFIDHNTGTSHWLDPRLSKFQKKSLEDCQDDELPYGWEKICDPHYGTYYIDHVNRKTQYENPVLQAKRMQEQGGSGGAGGGGIGTSSGGPMRPLDNGPPGLDAPGSGGVASGVIGNGGVGGGRVNHFTKNPAMLRGERLMTTLVKSTRGLGFTIVGGDDSVEEFLQIKSIVPNGPAWLDGRLKMGDVLVYVNDICVLGFTHHEMVNIFQSIMPGEEVHLDVCRGYQLPFDPNDPNTEVVTTIAVDGLTNGGAVTDSELKFLENGGFLDPAGRSSDVPHKNPLAKIQSPGGVVTSNGGDVYFNDTLSYQQHYKGKTVGGAFEMPELLHINIVKSDNGFGFTITDSSYGQRVKKILDRQCCKNLQEGDVLLSINSISVKDMTHNEVVQVLKDCPKNIETTLKVQRGPGGLFGGGSVAAANVHPPPGGSSKLTNKLRKGIELAKFGGSSSGGGLLKKEGGGPGGSLLGNGSLFRSKTPTADLYSTQTKEILPTRPKTPLVDTRARAKTPSLPLADLNADEIELDGGKLQVATENGGRLELNLKSNGSSHDTDSIANDIGMYHQADEQYHHHTHLKHSNLSDRLGELTISSSNNSEAALYHHHQPAFLHQQQQQQLQHSAGAGGPYHNPNGGNNMGGVGGYNQLYSPPLVPPPPVPPLSAGGQPPYHHENCFCYECQDYQQRQQQQQQQRHLQQLHHHQQQQQQHLMNQRHQLPPGNASMHNVGSPSPHLQQPHQQQQQQQQQHNAPYNLPPQMSDNIGKRLNEYLMDRKRSLHQGPPGAQIGPPPPVPQYDNLHYPQHMPPPHHQSLHLLHGHHPAPTHALYDAMPPQQPSPSSQHHHHQPYYGGGPVGVGMNQSGNANWMLGQGQHQQSQLSPSQHHFYAGGGGGYPGVNAGLPLSSQQLDEYTLSEVTLERQALGFGFRIVGGTEEGSQVTVGHIVPGGAADKDTRIATGDEILNINGVNVENASHHRVVQLMGEAGLRGQVTMILRRRQLSKPPAPPPNPRYPYTVLVTRKENEGFGFVIISSSGQFLGSSIGDLIPGSPAERCGELKIGDRIIAVNSIDITGMSHSDVVNLIKESGLQVKLTIDSPRDGIMHPAIGSLIQPSVPTTTSAAGSPQNGGTVGGGPPQVLSSNTDLYVSSNSTSGGSTNGPTINRYPAIIS